MRIPIWPGIRLSIWEPQNPAAVNVTLPFNRQPPTVRRVLSMRGWMILLVRYGWRDIGQPGPTVAEQRISDAVDVIREWQQHPGPTTDQLNNYLTRVHRALRPPVSGVSQPISDTAAEEPTP
jgi:hypothetical protein